MELLSKLCTRGPLASGRQLKVVSVKTGAHCLETPQRGRRPYPIDKEGQPACVDPEHNAMPSPILKELAQVITNAGNDDEVKVIVLKSGGDRTFCAGASFKELIAIDNLEAGDLFFSGFANVINAMRTCGKIIIGRVQGKAVGGGVGLASATDYCLATKYAAIKLSEISIGIGMLILIAGIVGIGNILVFIIKERTKEIGVRKALGAKPFDVIKLVLLESVFITSISGLIGMLFAMAVVALISPIIDAPAFSNPSVDNVTIITATIVLVVAGVLAGLIPAMKAASVKPIVALRAD